MSDCRRPKDGFGCEGEDVARQEPSNHIDRVVTALAAGGAARSPLVASWSRSARLHGLSPEIRSKPVRLTETELHAARDRMEAMIRTAAPSLDRLFQAVGGVGCCVMLADSEGVPVERRGAIADDVTFEDWGLWTGTVWSEAQDGTNGIGTCLAEGRQVTIHRNQHFLARNTGLSCITAPIHDAEGRIAGALDVSSARADLTEGFLGLIALSVTDAARRIEADLFRLAFPRARLMMVPGQDRGNGALLAVDADDLVIGATHAARQALGLAGDLAAQPRPVADLLGQGADDGFEAAERAVVARALARAGGNVSAAARALGISRATLHRKLGPRAGLRPDPLDE